MRTCLIFLLLLLCRPSFGQEKNVFTDHQLSVDFGSFRNRYLYPITDLQYGSPVLQKVPLRFSARLRSYGTLFFYSRSSYDVTPLAEYYFTDAMKPVYFSAGIGTDIRLRFVHDERSTAVSSAEPLVSLAFHGNFKKLSLETPLWTRFYSNGISFTLLPEASYRLGNRISIFARYELSYLAIYKVSAHEWRQDCFLGTHILF
jgi:hypothetical protein